MPLVRSFPQSLAAFLLASFALSAYAPEPITGTVTTNTPGKPSAGDTVVLIQLQQGMQESTRTTSDARGHFSLDVPDEGVHLVRVTHDKAAYFQPVQPDQHNVAVTVYDAAAKIDGVHTNVEELHVEATPTELHIVELLQVVNESSPQRTQFSASGFDFYLPPGALVGRTGAITQGGMPVQTPAVPQGEPGHFSFLFPIRPGETQFGIAYTVPYTGKFTFSPRLSTAVKTFAVLVPTSMTLTPGSGSPLASQTSKPGTQSFLAQDIAAGPGPQFTLAGTGSLPQLAAGEDNGAGPNGAGPNASTANPGSNADSNAPAVSNSELAGGRGLNNPLDEAGDRDPWAKYKWWILSGLALLLAAAAGVLLRKPAAGTVPLAGNVPLPQPAAASLAAGQASAPVLPDAVLTVLKEELFVLETERLQRRISEPTYRQARSALELVLGRVLDRQSGVTPGSPTLDTGPTGRPDPQQQELPEPVLTGREGA